jgi:hypothetical protein
VVLLEHEPGAFIKWKVSFALGARDHGRRVTRQEALALLKGRCNQPATDALPLKIRRHGDSMHMIVPRAFDERAIALTKLAARGRGAQERAQPLGLSR